MVGQLCRWMRWHLSIAGLFRKSETKQLRVKQNIIRYSFEYLIKKNSVNEGDIYFSINESYEPHFDMAIDVIIDLSAILLESIKNGKVDIKELDPNSKYSNFFSISTSKDDAMLLLSGLNKFINAPQEYELADFMDESELEELVGDCKEISGILTNCISQI